MQLQLHCWQTQIKLQYCHKAVLIFNTAYSGLTQWFPTLFAFEPLTQPVITGCDGVVCCEHFSDCLISIVEAWRGKTTTYFTRRNQRIDQHKLFCAEEIFSFLFPSPSSHPAPPYLMQAVNGSPAAGTIGDTIGVGVGPRRTYIVSFTVKWYTVKRLQATHLLLRSLCLRRFIHCDGE